MDWIEFAKGAGGTGIGVWIFLVWLNYRGQLLWRSQVEREIAAIKEAATKLDAVRVEQIAEEREDKNDWKGVAETYRASIETMRSAIDSKKAV